MSEDETHGIVDTASDAELRDTLRNTQSDRWRYNTPEGRTELNRVIAEMHAAHADADPPRPFPVVIFRTLFPWGAVISDRWNSRPAGVRMWQPWMWLFNLRPGVKPAEGAK